MNSFRQRIPGFVDATPATVSFNTTEELLNSEVVRKYIDENYTKFVIDENMLLIVSEDSLHWWVLGYIDRKSVV
jgi:hypothetical protein